MPEPPSVEPEPVTVTGRRVHERPPDTVGSVGAVRSSLTVLPAAATAGAHADALPAASTARNWTMVVPSTLTITDGPLTGADPAGQEWPLHHTSCRWCPPG